MIEPGALMGERRRLTDLAYRLLGSVAEAEDAVQEAYARWYAMPPEQQREIASPAGWLTTVTGRICLDVLRSARARRERYVGEWLPEPVPGPTGADPADRITLDESISMAFLVVLESMTPAERVAFILHDVFGYPFSEVAEIVGRTPAACRQLAVSARRRIGAAQPPPAPAAATAGLVRAFKRAWEAKDLHALITILDPGAVAVADGGGRASALPDPLEGGERIAHACVEWASRAPELELVETTVNGQPGLLGRLGGVPVAVWAFAVADGRIARIWAVRNPEKLRAWDGRLAGRPLSPAACSGRAARGCAAPAPRARAPRGARRAATTSPGRARPAAGCAPACG
ncbi:MAG TPA: RNA polymerase sigma factor SigJ [Pseudonocardia sp.]|uniref:RNA polymerase sigma factor SigJ n=1 Tax=Pseudonocardia sp. TaxID=60912 RepID=UPI002B4AFD19|nr:RNA polymerase sigma factor SigJ [Pseudonocardia sp.]HLU55640.1 RNA polymerase sigma factor SigJ [Pseudonocardia sp.]